MGEGGVLVDVLLCISDFDIYVVGDIVVVEYLLLGICVCIEYWVNVFK